MAGNGSEKRSAFSPYEAVSSRRHGTCTGLPSCLSPPFVSGEKRALRRYNNAAHWLYNNGWSRNSTQIGAVVRVMLRGVQRAYKPSLTLLLLVMALAPCTALCSGSLDLPSIGAWGIDLTDRDTSVKPGDDFYKWENGAWLSSATIDPAKFANSYWLDLRVLNAQRVGAILEAAAADRQAKADSVKGKLGRFYHSFMDVQNLDRLGLSPIEPMLEEIRAAESKSKLIRLMAKLDGPWRQRSFNVVTPPTGASLFSIAIAQDTGDPTRNAVYIGQAGAFLPAIDYYVDPKLADIKAKYVHYVAQVLERVKWPDAESQAKEVVDFETKVAELSCTPQELKDPAATYNPMSLVELKALTPTFDWDAYFAGAEALGVQRVVVNAKPAFPKLAKLFGDTPLQVLKARAAFSLLHVNGFHLDSQMYKLYNDFWVQTLTGGGSAPRALRASNLVMANIGTLLDSEYLQAYFPEPYRRAANALVRNIKGAADQRLARCQWMSTTSVAKARAKLASLVMRIGGPERSETFTNVVFDKGDLIGNLHKATGYIWKRDVASLKRPFDRNRWLFGSSTVNYIYLPSANALEIPAGLLQAPFFDPNADAAVNYGAAGSLIGHMMFLALGDTGRHYDEVGRMRDWLPASDAAKFEQLAAKMKAQYSLIEPVPGFHIKGDLLIDESLADQGGMLAAYDGYLHSLKGGLPETIDGYTGDQRFFMGRAQMWRAKFREAFLKNQTATAQNAPPYVRINEVNRNIDAWYKAFDVRPGDLLYRDPGERVRVW